MAELIADKSFDLNNTSEYNLSIRISPDGFSFVITDSNHQNLIAIKSELLKISSEHFIAGRIAEWINSQELLSKNYREVRILFFTNIFSLIPEEFYSEEKNSELVNRLFGPLENHIIKVNVLPKINSRLLFCFPDNLADELDKHFQNYSFFHPAQLLLQNLTETNTGDNKIALLPCSQNFYLLIFKDDKLLVANNYNYNQFDDILYFILSNLRQCEIEPRDAKLFLVNDDVTSKKSDGIETGLKKYLGTVKLVKSTLNFNPGIFKNADLRNPLLLLK